jgi:hypothetical protein
MKHMEKSRIAWRVWNLLNEISDLLWVLYEEEFFHFCYEDETPECVNDHDNVDEPISNPESVFAVTQNKKEE